VPSEEVTGDPYCFLLLPALFCRVAFLGTQAVPDILMLVVIVLAVLAPAGYAALCPRI